VLRNTKFGERSRLQEGRFCRLIWGNLILSLLNKICINSGVIRRHGGGVFDDLILYRYMRCSDSGVRARAFTSARPDGSRDRG
jgi:hypothetical protein